MVNIVCCGYRDWALEIINNISNHPNVNIVRTIHSYEEYQSHIDSFTDNIELILFLGWSWIIPPKITNKYLCLGIHPSDLPLYRGGSPIQNQIINGVEESKVTLMTLSSKKLDAGDIWLKENLDLSGNTITKIFNNITKSSTKLLNNFFNVYPNILPAKQNISDVTYFKRRKPEQGKITFDHIKDKSLNELYNFIRCLSDPYPNAYMEDTEGNRLLIKEVEYIPKINNELDKDDK